MAAADDDVAAADVSAHLTSPSQTSALATPVVLTRSHAAAAAAAAVVVESWLVEVVTHS